MRRRRRRGVTVALGPWANHVQVQVPVLIMHAGMQFRLIRRQIRGQFIRNSGATLDYGAAAGSVTRAAAASPRAGTQGIRRCVGCRRGHLQAAAAGPPRAANLSSATGEFVLGARRARAHARALGTRPRCGRARLHAHHPGPGQPRSAPRAIWPRAQARAGWLVASPASPAAAGGCCSTAAAAAAADSHCLLAAATAGCRD